MFAGNNHALLDVGLELALLNWSRAAEFSADRAALLAVQDGKLAARALGRLAVGSRKLAEQINVDELIEQANDFDNLGKDLLSKFYKETSHIGQDHPFLILRIKEALNWANQEMPRYLEKSCPTQRVATEPSYFV